MGEAVATDGLLLENDLCIFIGHSRGNCQTGIALDKMLCPLGARRVTSNMTHMRNQLRVCNTHSSTCCPQLCVQSKYSLNRRECEKTERTACVSALYRWQRSVRVLLHVLGTGCVSRILAISFDLRCAQRVKTISSVRPGRAEFRRHSRVSTRTTNKMDNNSA